MEILNYTSHSLIELQSIGIYKIEHSSQPGKVYIGSAIGLNSNRSFFGFLRRWCRHLTELKNKNHCNRKLQRIVNKYGLSGLKFSIIERCSQENGIIRENYYIETYDSYKKGLNLRPKANSALGTKHSKETLAKMSKAQKGRIIKRESIDKANETKRLKKEQGIKDKPCGFLSRCIKGSKKVYIYTRQGDSFACCYSTQDCDKFFGISKGKSSIYISLRTFIKKQYLPSYKELTKEEVLQRVEEINISRSNAQLRAWITRKNKKIPC